MDAAQARLLAKTARGEGAVSDEGGVDVGLAAQRINEEDGQLKRDVMPLDESTAVMNQVQTPNQLS